MGPKANGLLPGEPGKLRPVKSAALLILVLMLSGSKPIGYGVEVCAKVAGALKAQPRFVQVKRAEGLRALAEGRMDVLCDAFIPTPASRREVSFSIPVF